MIYICCYNILNFQALKTCLFYFVNTSSQTFFYYFVILKKNDSFSVFICKWSKIKIKPTNRGKSRYKSIINNITVNLNYDTTASLKLPQPIYIRLKFDKFGIHAHCHTWWQMALAMNDWLIFGKSIDELHLIVCGFSLFGLETFNIIDIFGCNLLNRYNIFQKLDFYY